jgi:hypothetical protein
VFKKIERVKEKEKQKNKANFCVYKKKKEENKWNKKCEFSRF